jgi:predicted nucleic acid-binding protein
LLKHGLKKKTMEINIQKIRSLIGKVGVLDNNILNDFTELQCISLLNKVFVKVYIPQSILDREAILETIQSNIEWLEYQPTALEHMESYVFLSKILTEKPALTEYDAECIAIAKEKMIYCTSNEKRVMGICEEYDIECTGTIGILCCAYEHEIISREEFEHLLKKLFSSECSAYLGKKVRQVVFSYYKIM